MTKQAKKQVAPAPVDNVVELPSVVTVADEPQAIQALSEVDRLALELAKTNFKLSQSQAEKALAQNDTAQLAYKYVVLQLYMKYGLTEADAIAENGTIVRGGALPQNQG